MTDCGFPIIVYQKADSAVQRGRQHGESFRAGIAELTEIRTDLMREKNPSLTTEKIAELAAEQWHHTEQFAPELAAEIKGIGEGADRSLTDLVVLNNYTDFRDIVVEDQGCSLAYVNSELGPVVGQTWDMHGSAKRYVCCIDTENEQTGRTVLFSVVGCVGMMGFNSVGGMLGVNNINTDGARAGVLWPVIVRSVLQQPGLAAMAKCLTESPKTSGHNYLIAHHDHAEMWEVAPDCNERVGQKLPRQHGHIFHTNHCLSESLKQRESEVSINSTTHIRYDLLQRKIVDVKSLAQMHDLMNDHENYPKSICSNFQSGAQDPSITCGGAVGHLLDRKIMMWRGDRMYDENFVEHTFHLFPAVN